MALFKKVKDWLGIEGVKVQLHMPESFRLREQLVSGQVEVTTQSDQYLESVVLTLKEKYQRGRRKSKLIDEYTMAQKNIVVNQPISTDSSLVLDFELDFVPLESGMDRFGSKNIFNRGLVAIARMMKNAKSSYYVIAEVSVKGNRLKPFDKAVIVAD